MNKKIAVIILGFCISSIAYAKTFILRPVTLKIYSEDTKTPLSNVYVIRSVGKEIYDTSKGLKQHPYRTTKDLIYEEYFSDENGIVEMKSHIINLSNHEYILGEGIFINVSVGSKKKREMDNTKLTKEYLRFNFDVAQESNLIPKDLFLYNPLKSFRGFAITSDLYPLDPRFDENDFGGTERSVFDILFNFNGLNRNHETFIIYLKKKAHSGKLGKVKINE